MIRIDGIRKHYGEVRAVDGIDLEIADGSMVGIVGSSGAGKSTLLRLMNRLIEPTDGSIWYGEREVTALKGPALLDWRNSCAMIFQQFNLVDRLSVLTNVLTGTIRSHTFVTSMLGVFSREERTQAAHLLEQLGILDQALKRCDQLSGGQQQRVAIARAMMQQPKILLADEPIASLDARSSEQVMNALVRINREMGITVIASVHDLIAARTYFDRLIGISDGKLVFDGPPEELTSEQVRLIYDARDAEEELRHAGEEPRPAGDPDRDEERVAVTT
ncbi:MAG: phosphonate ABC transporter ATP-binding protein [Spirochaetota bacterium]